MCFAPQQRALFRHLNFKKCSEPCVFRAFWLGNVLRATTASPFSTSQLPKVVRDRQFLTLLTWKCASRHNGVHFFDVSTSKSALNLVCFVHFDLDMCFAPQHQLPKVRCFVHFDLEMCFVPQRRALFSTPQLPKVVRECTLYILTWKCASRHNRVQLFISHLTTWLRTRRFSEPTFQPSGATNHRKKHSVSCGCYLFAHLSLLWSSLFCSSLLWLFPPLLFHLSILSEVWLLNFLRW